MPNANNDEWADERKDNQKSSKFMCRAQFLIKELLNKTCAPFPFETIYPPNVGRLVIGAGLQTLKAGALKKVAMCRYVPIGVIRAGAALAWKSPAL